MNASDMSGLGIYVSPQAIVEHPEYAARLRTEANVQIFVLRTGFNPEAENSALDTAVSIVRNLGADVWLLTGTWWGHGVSASGDQMVSAIVVPDALRGPSHEAQWSMRTPGGPADDVINRALERFCERYAPEAICLTHSRYRHPADVTGLFESGPGPFADGAAVEQLSPTQLAESWNEALAGLSGMSADDLEVVAEDLRLDELLDRLSNRDTFTRWFRYRASVVELSIQRFRETVSAASKSAVRFGQNAYGPHAAFLCGQDYARMEGLVDFVQPLLGYVEWHERQPVAVWAKILLSQCDGLAESTAIRIAAGLLGLRQAPLSRQLAEVAAVGEGPAEAIEAIVERLLILSSDHQTQRLDVLPVLRGSGWPIESTNRLRQRVRDHGFSGLIFQGTEALLGSAPGVGWA